MQFAKIIGFWIGFALLFGCLFLFGRLADRTVKKPDEGAKDVAAAPKESKGGRK